MQLTPGTRAFVTGASRGIGRALAGALAARGVTLGLAARSTDELAALAAELPGEHHVLECDVADAASTQAAIDGFAQRAGGLELLVANAGITHYGPFRDQPLDKALQMSQVNWHGTLHTVHFGLPHLLERAPRPHRRRLQRRRAALVPAGRGLRRDEGRPAHVRRGAAPRARRHRRLADDRLPGRDRHLPARPREGPHAGVVPRRPAGGAGRGAGREDRRRDRERRARRLLPAARARARHRPRRSARRPATPSCAACAATARRRGAADAQPGVRWRGGSVRSRRASSASPSRASPRNSREAGDSGALARETKANVV